MIIINCSINNNIRLNFNIERLAKKISKIVFEFEKINYDISFALSFISKRKIIRINRIERGINKPTDVLSFPNINFNKPCNFKPYMRKNSVDVSIIDLNTKTIFLGDVVICLDVMKKQANQYGHSVKREFSFLLIHSLLHLLGYDHIKKNDENIMFKKQKEILSILSINR